MGSEYSVDNGGQNTVVCIGVTLGMVMREGRLPHTVFAVHGLPTRLLPPGGGKPRPVGVLPCVLKVIGTLLGVAAL